MVVQLLFLFVHHLTSNTKKREFKKKKKKEAGVRTAAELEREEGEEGGRARWRRWRGGEKKWGEEKKKQVCKFRRVYGQPAGGAGTTPVSFLSFKAGDN